MSIPKLSITESFLRAAQVACDAVERLHGAIELAWSAYGRWVMAESPEIVLTHPVVLKATCGTHSFSVTAKDLSEIGRRASAEIGHLRMLGQVHRHPWPEQPFPSYVDQKDRQRMSALYRDCGARELVTVREVAASGATYSLDPRIVVRCPTSLQPPEQLVCEYRTLLSYQTFVIVNAHADRDRIYAQIVEYKRLPFGVDTSIIYDDCPVAVLADQDAATLLELTLPQVTCDVDSRAIERTVQERVIVAAPIGWKRTEDDIDAGWDEVN
jgi:hypothetical protein